MPIITIDTKKLKEQGIGPRVVAKVKLCKVSKEEIEKDRWLLPAELVVKAIQRSAKTLGRMSAQNRFPRKTEKSGESFYDIQDILEFMRVLLFETDIDIEIKKEKHKKLVIENKSKLGELMRKETAEERQIVLLKAIMRKFNYVIKTASPLLTMCPSKKEVETILMDQYREVFEILENESQRVEWAREEDAALSDEDEETDIQ